jgi:hypothetical protein
VLTGVACLADDDLFLLNKIRQVLKKLRMTAIDRRSQTRPWPMPTCNELLVAGTVFNMIGLRN